MKKKRKIDWSNQLIGLIVVFLGVTGGFILQNNKEEKALKNLEVKYIEGFLADVEENINTLRDDIEGDSIWVNKYRNMIKLISIDALPIDSANKLIQSMAYFSEFAEQTDTYENISNSGNFNIIGTYEIRQKIIAYHKSIRDFQLLESYFKDFFSNTFMPFILKEFDIFTQKLVTTKQHKSVVFKNLVGTQFSLRQQRLSAYKDLYVESVKMKTVLSQENLKNRK